MIKKFFSLDLNSIGKHENYRELIWALAKTDFKLRYHGSVLGYVWSLLKPLLIFSILNFVFSSIFNPKNTGDQFYSLQLLVGIMLFNFFAEGTTAGMNSLLAKYQLVTKIYIPRWTIIVASTINAMILFAMNLIVIVAFFMYYHKVPSIEAVLLFFLYIILVCMLILAMGFFAAPLYVRFRDFAMIWEIILQALFYASPIVYPLSLLPMYVQEVVLINPIAFIIHFTKTGLISNHFAPWWETMIFASAVCIVLGASILLYRKTSKNIAENI